MDEDLQGYLDWIGKVLIQSLPPSNLIVTKKRLYVTKKLRILGSSNFWCLISVFNLRDILNLTRQPNKCQISDFLIS